MHRCGLVERAEANSGCASNKVCEDRQVAAEHGVGRGFEPRLEIAVATWARWCPGIRQELGDAIAVCQCDIEWCFTGEIDLPEVCTLGE